MFFAFFSLYYNSKSISNVVFDLTGLPFLCAGFHFGIDLINLTASLSNSCFVCQISKCTKKKCENIEFDFENHFIF